MSGEYDRLLNSVHRAFEMHHGACWPHVVRNCPACRPMSYTHDEPPERGIISKGAK